MILMCLIYLIYFCNGSYLFLSRDFLKKILDGKMIIQYDHIFILYHCLMYLNNILMYIFLLINADITHTIFTTK